MGKSKKLTPFGKVVRKRLVDLDMNQNDLAAQFGISGAHLHYILCTRHTKPPKPSLTCDAQGPAP